jgi:2-alkyl-3-oxoalkanoate reductase
MTDSSPVVVVTGANGLVGAAVCRALVSRSAQVRAVVRRAGSAPALDGVTEHVGDFADEAFAREVTEGADAVVTTVHPMGSDRETQHRIAVEGTSVLARAARDAGVPRLVHLSTAAVYDRSPGAGDLDESSPLVGDRAGPYAATKRDTDAALAEVDGITRVLLRPPAVLGPGESSLWNRLRPAQMRDDEQARRALRALTFAWVHVDDLVSLVADVASGKTAPSSDPEQGPVQGGCTAVNVAGGPATATDYYGTVCRAIGVDPVWDDGPAWTGRIRTGRAERWGWAATVDLAAALAELETGLRSSRLR